MEYTDNNNCFIDINGENNRGKNENKICAVLLKDLNDIDGI